MIERRGEPRVPAGFSVQVWGTDAEGEPFSQNAVAINVSESGALLSNLEHEPRCGDLIGIAYDGRKARFRVIWTLASGGSEKVRVAAQRLDGDRCPWQAVLLQTESSLVSE